MRKSIFFLSISTLVFMSCKNNHAPEPGHNPVISLSAPTPGSMYNNGDTVFMSVAMEDEEELHEGYLYIRTATDTLFMFQPFVHELPAYDKDTFWVVSGIVSNTNAFVTALDLNHVEGSDTAEVPIMLMP
jgi:hypothetical protein